MKGVLTCLLLCCLFGLCAGNGVPVCLKTFTLLADIDSYGTVYLSCDNGKFVDLGMSRDYLEAQEFDPPKEVEESLFYYETVNCNVRVEGSYRSEDYILGSFKLRGYDFDREDVVGRRTSSKFLVQFVRCPEEKPPQTVPAPPPEREVWQWSAARSRATPPQTVPAPPPEREFWHWSAARSRATPPQTVPAPPPEREFWHWSAAGSRVSKVRLET